VDIKLKTAVLRVIRVHDKSIVSKERAQQLNFAAKKICDIDDGRSSAAPL
jgi:hypothetical protein